MPRPKKYNNKKRLVIEVDDSLHNIITSMAKLEGKSIRDYFVQNVLLEIQGCCIFCPNCESPVLDQRTIHVDGTLTITCRCCQHEFIYKEKEIYN